MDENEIELEDFEVVPRLHNKWSILVLAANWAAQMAAVTAKSLELATIMAAEHATQKNYDNEFNEITKEI